MNNSVRLVGLRSAPRPTRCSAYRIATRSFSDGEYDNTGYWKRARQVREWRKNLGEMHTEGRVRLHSQFLNFCKKNVWLLNLNVVIQERMEIFTRKAYENIGDEGTIDPSRMEAHKKIDAMLMGLQYDFKELGYHLGRGAADDIQQKWGHKWGGEKND